MRRRAVLHVLEPRTEATVRAALRSCQTTAPRVAVLAKPVAGGRVASLLPLGVLAARALTTRARVIHAHGGAGAWAAWRTASAIGGRFGISLQGPDLRVAVRDDVRLQSALVWASIVVTPSQFLADVALANHVPHARVHVIPPGVDVAASPYRERGAGVRPPLLVFHGAFDEQSGVLDVARALSQVGQPLRAVFAGHGPLEAELRALLPEASVVRPETAEQLREVLHEADLAVFGGRHTDAGDAEAWGQTAVEAQACGLPVVATRNGGLPEWVSADGAVLVPSHGDVVGSLSEAVEDLLTRPQDWAAMGLAGRRHVEQHLDVKARTAELEQLWTALSGRGPLTALRGALMTPPDHV